MSKRRPFLGALKEAFQGESADLAKPVKSYQSHEERRIEFESSDCWNEKDADNCPQDYLNIASLANLATVEQKKDDSAQEDR
ncbi:hypothetical protein ACSS6W_010294 [Trichoderma asperelloides]